MSDGEKRVPLSSAYALRLTYDRCARTSAVQLAVEHTDPSGYVSIRGGFHVPMMALDDVIFALEGMRRR